MAEEGPKDQQEKQGGEGPKPHAPTWEMVLRRASQDALTAPAPPSPASPPASARYLRWVKALTPVLVLLLYVTYKVASQWHGNDYGVAPVRHDPESLTGIAPAQDQRLRMDADVKEFVARLEALRNRNQWQELRRAVEHEPRQQVREHPVVQALALLAASRSNVRSLEHERALQQAEETLRPGESDFGDLLQEIRIARAEQIVQRCNSSEIYSLNTDTLHRILGQEVESNYEVRVRTQLARQLESIAESMMTNADGFISDDTVMISQARSYYQEALRWIVLPQEWIALKPISPSAQAEIERILAALRIANRKVHGPSLPLTNNDSTTWSGRKGTPVHDNPAGGAS